MSGVDKEASQRFIKHALSGNTDNSQSASNTEEPSSETSSKKKKKKKAKKNKEAKKQSKSQQSPSSSSSDDNGGDETEKTKAPMTGKKRLRATSTTLGNSMVSKALSSSKRSTPEPKLTHLNWKEELKKKKGKKD